MNEPTLEQFMQATKEDRVFHLTLTGYEAGRPLCDCNREVEKHNGARFFHAVYAPRAVFLDARLCKACKRVWDDSAND